MIAFIKQRKWREAYGSLTSTVLTPGPRLHVNVLYSVIYDATFIPTVRTRWRPWIRTVGPKRTSNVLAHITPTHTDASSNVSHLCLSGHKGHKTRQSDAVLCIRGGGGQTCWLVSCSQLGHFRERCNKCSLASRFGQIPYTHVTIKPRLQRRR